MHAEQKRRFKRILAADPDLALTLWQELQPLLTLHEQIEDELLYRPLLEQQGLGTPLGDWQPEHRTQVDAVQALVADSTQFPPADPRWCLCLAKIHDLLHKHIMEEELEVFPRVDQALGPDQSRRIGEQMQSMLDRGHRAAGLAAAESGAHR
jgi:hemerythrin-like domain-containing protein